MKENKLQGFKKIRMTDRCEWDDIISKFSQADSYYTFDYVNALRIHGDGTPYIFFYEGDKNNSALNVVMLRNIGDIEYIHLDMNDYYDIISPYGYGGFIYNGNWDVESLAKLEIDYTKFCIENNIVCEFVRFHPILRNYEKGKYIYETVYIGDTVYINLENEDIIWNNITSKNRNMIRKSLKNNVKIFHTNSRNLIHTFMEMYKETMDRDEATSYYYFEKEYYEAIFESQNEDVNFFYAMLDEEIISMSIILKHASQLHYHLSASRYKYRGLAPTNLLLYEVAKWGVSQGCTTFHLGGGVGGDPEDSLFKFKKSFNRNSESKFYIGKKIFDKKVYDMIVESIPSKKKLRDNFFPVYRGTI